MIVSRIQTYIFWECVAGLLMTLGIILGAILLVDMVEQLRTVGARTELSLLGAFQLTALKAPQLILETMPFAILVGSMLAYSKLNRSSELSAIRASGVSAWRFLAPTFFLAAFLGCIAMTIIDPLATFSNAKYETEKTLLLDDTGAVKDSAKRQKKVWLRQGTDTTQSVIHGEVLPNDNSSLQNVEIFILEKDGDEFEFQRRIDAKKATLRPGFWQLEGVTEYSSDNEPIKQDYLALTTTLDPSTILDRGTDEKSISFWKLPQLIQDARRAGLDADKYILKLHTLLAMPVLLGAMALIGAVVCLRLRRSGGVTQLLAAGIGAGFLLFFVNQVSKGLASSGATPPQAAAWAPALIALFSVLSIIAFAEDG
ncbi:LPS export ABC transporter permease LptG [Hirschia baltica]|uniref:Permease YjgP/YjgQ family protein n=1 Tax=Hirschia baltica (strain ATCC 49814 / DSM 5838 / IFAM 1418) TaxID=582402 RepID=C6XKP6_HIRBI|nr:LPS export ABC transporter permease LptG [Hirschia baltica]ACT59613.1 permease YjgP/YjgQ family protein [Hirschia baltica ATCC 49814]